MDNVILTLHIIVCVLLIIFVLLQAGREGMGVIFGGGSSSLFGSAGAGGILAKVTTIAAIIFFCTSLGYSVFISGRDSSSASRVQQINIEDFVPPQAPAGVESPASAE